MALRWYIVQVYSNFEKKVAEAITRDAEKKDLAHLIDRVVIPAEKVVEIRRGRKVDSDRKFFPGYVLLRAELTDAIYHLIKNTPKVSGFLGDDSKAIPIPDSEIESILMKMEEGKERPKSMVHFEIGEQVRVADGPFASFNGIVQDIEEERSRLRVEVSIFGRATPVELEFNQVEKIQ